MSEQPQEQKTPEQLEREAIAGIAFKMILPHLEQLAVTLNTGLDTKLQQLFQSPEFMDTLTVNILRNAVNAIVDRAQEKSQDQQYVVVNNYIAGAWRVTLAEDGAILVERQLAEAAEKKQSLEGWDIDPATENEVLIENMRIVLNSFGVAPGSIVFMLSKKALEEARIAASSAINQSAV